MASSLVEQNVLVVNNPSTAEHGSILSWLGKKYAVTIRVEAAQRVGIQLPRALGKLLKKRTILCAQRSAAMPGWAAALR